MLFIAITNDTTGNDRIGNYNYEVFINDRKIAIGRIDGHYRPNGWKGLIRCMEQQIIKSKNVDELDNTLLKFYEICQKLN